MTAGPTALGLALSKAYGHSSGKNMARVLGSPSCPWRVSTIPVDAALAQSHSVPRLTLAASSLIPTIRSGTLCELARYCCSVKQMKEAVTTSPEAECLSRDQLACPVLRGALRPMSGVNGEGSSTQSNNRHTWVTWPYLLCDPGSIPFSLGQLGVSIITILSSSRHSSGSQPWPLHRQRLS